MKLAEALILRADCQGLHRFWNDKPSGGVVRWSATNYCRRWETCSWRASVLPCV